MELFGIGWVEMLVIGLVALIVVGPDRLPQAAQTIGRVVGYFTRQWKNIQQEIRQPVEGELVDLKGKFEDSIQEVVDLDPMTPKTEKKQSKQVD